MSDRDRVLAVLRKGGRYPTYELARLAKCAHNSTQRAIHQLRKQYNIQSRKLQNSQVHEYWISDAETHQKPAQASAETKQVKKRCHSHLFDQEFDLYTDGSVRFQDGTEYTAAEVSRIKDEAKADLRVIHEVKRLFGGTLELSERKTEGEVIPIRYQKAGRRPRGRIWGSKEHRYVA